MNKFESSIDSLRTNPNMYRAWDKSKKYGRLQWLAFGLFSIVPLGKLLCGKGQDHVEKLKRDQCILKLDGSGLETYGIRFYLPNFEEDAIQKEMVLTRHFFERAELANLKENYIRQGDVCLDIGANIGNHSIFYAKVCRASKVYSFEPIKSTFDILEKNISLNTSGGGVIEAFNFGISDKAKQASIIHFEENNIGATQLAENSEGDLKLVALDDLAFPDKVDFVKIDVEGMEYDVLCGGKKFFQANKPVIFIEIWEENIGKVDALLKQLGYKLIEKRPTENYVYGIA